MSKTITSADLTGDSYGNSIGNQITGTRGYELRARAVRRLPIE